MKKLSLVLSLFFVLAALMPVTPAAAQVETYPAELQYYDAQIDLMLPRLTQFQSLYYTVNSRYYQALESHTAAPDVPTVPDAIYYSPTDQPEDLALFWNIAELPELLAWSFRIDTYSGPEGDGYVVTCATVVNDVTWKRSVNVGPDTWRAADWYAVTSEF